MAILTGGLTYPKSAIGPRKPSTLTYHLGRWQVLYLLVENRFNVFARLGYNMIGAIERHAVGEHQTDIRNELVGMNIARVVAIHVRLLRVGGHELALNSAKIHRILNYARIVGNVQGDGVNGIEKRPRVFHLFQRAYGRKTEPMLV